MVEHREEHRLKDHALGERALDDQHGGLGEVELTVGIAPQRPREPVVGEPLDRVGVDDIRLTEPVELGLLEAEVVECVEEAPDAGDHAVAPAFGQPAREQLEHGSALCRPVPQRRLQHRQLIAVGQQCRTGKGVHESSVGRVPMSSTAMAGDSVSNCHRDLHDSLSEVDLRSGWESRPSLAAQVQGATMFGLRRISRACAALVSIMLFSTTFSLVPPAQGASTLLCKGVVACLLAGRSDAGYWVLGLVSYWSQTPGHNCTNYLAYRLTHGGRLVARPPGTASAYTWGDAARKAGVPVDDRPSVGAVAWWTAAAVGNSSGHVAYVEEVLADGSVVLSEDSLKGDFDWRHLTRSSGWPSGFIHYPKSDGSPLGTFDSVTSPVAGQIDFWGTSSDPDGLLLVIPVAPSYLVTLGGPRGTAGVESFTFSTPYFNFHRTKGVKTRGPTTMYLYALNTLLSSGHDVLLGSKPVTIRDSSTTTAAMLDATITAATAPSIKVTLAPTTATGRVDIKRGSTVLKSITFASGGTRTVTVALPKQVKGTHTIVASYVGSTKHLPSRATVTLTVR